jgi:lipopolysaccharide assembly LptE-like protein
MSPRTTLVCLALVGMLGCGYRVAGVGEYVPSTAQTIRIRTFRNHTRELGLDVHLRRALEDEFRRHGALRVVSDGDADLELSGDIRRFTTQPVAFSATDEAVQYQGIMHVSMRLVEKATGRVLQETKLLQETQDFGAVSGVVIASSPHFQRGTIDSRDLATLTNVQLGEARRRDALRDLVDITARDIYLQTMEGF